MASVGYVGKPLRNLLRESGLCAYPHKRGVGKVWVSVGGCGWGVGGVWVSVLPLVKFCHRFPIGHKKSPPDLGGAGAWVFGEFCTFAPCQPNTTR
jgi:hypothetical protein